MKDIQQIVSSRMDDGSVVVVVVVWLVAKLQSCDLLRYKMVVVSVVCFDDVVLFYEE